MIKLDNVSKVFKGDVVALREANCDIGKGEFVFLVGPSGSGKSTMIRLLNKQEEPSTGSIYVAGKDIGQLNSWKVPYLRRNIGLILGASAMGALFALGVGTDDFGHRLTWWFH